MQKKGKDAGGFIGVNANMQHDNYFHLINTKTIRSIDPPMHLIVTFKCICILPLHQSVPHGAQGIFLVYQHIYLHCKVKENALQASNNSWKKFQVEYFQKLTAKMSNIIKTKTDD